MLIAEYESRLREIFAACPDSEKIEATRLLCRTDLYFLLTEICGRADIKRQWLFDRCREVQAAPDGRLDLWAREHYKSTIITFGMTIQDILNDPDVTVGIFSHTRPIAKAFLRQIKREFESNELLKSLFPEILYSNPSKESQKWSEDDGIIVKRKANPKEATIEASGLVDGQPTSKHFTRLIYDDVVTKDSVTSPEQIEKTTEAWALSLNLGAAGGARRFIGTRYHFNDTWAAIMLRGAAIPRIHTATDDGTSDGEPVFLSREVLQEKRRDQGPYVFSCQFLQNPKADETQGFKREWVRYCKQSDGTGMNKYILVDAAGFKRKTNDYTSVWVIGLAEDKNYYVLDMVRDRLNLTERGALVMKLHRKWRPNYVRYERYGLMADIEHIKTLQDKENYHFDITEVGGSLGKNDRIKRLIPMFEQGHFYLPNSFWYTNYEGTTEDLVTVFVEQEYMAFPVPIHDDMLDSLARIAEPDLPLDWPMTYEEPERYSGYGRKRPKSHMVA